VALPDRTVAVAFWNLLLEAGIYINLALPPATPTGAPLLRSSVTAVHEAAQIDAAIEAFGAIGTELGVLAERKRVAV
jgi:8-amino-7-oxononanoate synthase